MTYLINKKPHRISAGGILIHENKVLLVEYNSEPLGNYFVAPGGGMEDGENTIEAIKREFLEETNLVVEPQNVVLIEDLDTKNYKMIKIWMTCHYISGEIKKHRNQSAKA